MSERRNPEQQVSIAPSLVRGFNMRFWLLALIVVAVIVVGVLQFHEVDDHQTQIIQTQTVNHATTYQQLVDLQTSLKRIEAQLHALEQARK